MMTSSIESSRPILPESEKEKQHRNSTYTTHSAAPSMTPSQYSREAGILEITDGLGRLDSESMKQQRFEVSEKKGEVIGKLALGAKLDRALRWRMSGQDAVFTGKEQQ